MRSAEQHASAWAAANPRPRLPPVTRYTLSRNPRSMRPFCPGGLLPGDVMAAQAGHIASLAVRLRQPYRQLSGRESRQLLRGRHTRHAGHTWQ